ncbi:DUF3592 domain-containing protein [Paeniglutamicibacter cryotolerans]|uniref:CHASE1-domain containing sensor protein n=1 Tax=Paeniglutamicibacter cryotolerans TaxID=670079 RepID=A0A839QID6_9MICC|nr:DUF3592 domain-containing protein [Paeniglutamicibacter cryotolerans]MBB2994504.1 CHASE1-domain containing sensor protein [Paeniglutamicibacter cryotolerans]
MKTKITSRLIGAVVVVLLLAFMALGLAFVGQGLQDRANAAAFQATDSTILQTLGTVKWVAGRTASTSLQVGFESAGGQSVETKIWTSGSNRVFSDGQQVELEYVLQHPTSARLRDGNAGKARTLGMLAGGGVMTSVAAFLIVVCVRSVVHTRRK